jgi:hypothetical protein
MFNRPGKKVSVAKVGFATLGLIWSAQAILASVTNGIAPTPEGHEDAALMYAFVFYTYLFLAIAVFAFCAHFFYKSFLSVSHDDDEQG